MKKAMLFIVAMMFSVAASAATYTLNPTTGSASVTFNGTSAISANFGSTDTVFSLDVVDGGASKIDFDYSPDGSFLSGMMTIVNNVTNDIFELALTSDFTTILNLVTGSYTVSFDSAPEVGNLNLGVSAVPVPAALFLFAPALLGFLGLRRKSVVAA